MRKLPKPTLVKSTGDYLRVMALVSVGSLIFGGLMLFMGWIFN